METYFDEFGNPISIDGIGAVRRSRVSSIQRPQLAQMTPYRPQMNLAVRPQLAQVTPYAPAQAAAAHAAAAGAVGVVGETMITVGPFKWTDASTETEIDLSTEPGAPFKGKAVYATYTKTDSTVSQPFLSQIYIGREPQLISDQAIPFSHLDGTVKERPLTLSANDAAYAKRIRVICSVTAIPGTGKEVEGFVSISGLYKNL